MHSSYKTCNIQQVNYDAVRYLYKIIINQLSVLIIMISIRLYY